MIPARKCTSGCPRRSGGKWGISMSGPTLACMAETGDNAPGDMDNTMSLWSTGDGMYRSFWNSMDVAATQTSG